MWLEYPCGIAELLRQVAYGLPGRYHYQRIIYGRTSPLSFVALVMDAHSRPLDAGEARDDHKHVAVDRRDLLHQLHMLAYVVHKPRAQHDIKDSEPAEVRGEDVARHEIVAALF